MQSESSFSDCWTIMKTFAKSWQDWTSCLLSESFRVTTQVTVGVSTVSMTDTRASCMEYLVKLYSCGLLACKNDANSISGLNTTDDEAAEPASNDTHDNHRGPLVLITACDNIFLSGKQDHVASRD